jgi:hypothetical protein
MLPKDEQTIIGSFMRQSVWAWIGKDDDEILCYMGLIPPTLLSDRAYLWLRTTEAMSEHIFVFVRYSQRVLAEMLQDFPAIGGHCEVSATKSIRWLKWLGANFGVPEGQLVPFTIRAKHD